MDQYPSFIYKKIQPLIFLVLGLSFLQVTWNEKSDYNICLHYLKSRFESKRNSLSSEASDQVSDYNNRNKLLTIKRGGAGEGGERGVWVWWVEGGGEGVGSVL